MKRNVADDDGGYLPNKQRRFNTEIPAPGGFALPSVNAYNVSPFSVPGLQKRNLDLEDASYPDQPSKRLRTCAFPAPIADEPTPVAAPPQPPPVSEQPQPATYNPAEMQLVSYVAPPGPFGNRTDKDMGEQPQAYPPLQQFMVASRRQAQNRREVFPLIRLPQSMFDNAPPPPEAAQNEIVVYVPLTETIAGPQHRQQPDRDDDSSDGESMQLD